MKSHIILLIFIIFVVFISGCTNFPPENYDEIIRQIQEKYNQIDNYNVTIRSEVSSFQQSSDKIIINQEKGSEEKHTKEVIRTVKRPDKWKDVKIISDGNVEGTFEICNGNSTYVYNNFARSDAVWDYKAGDDYVTKRIYKKGYCESQINKFFDVFIPLLGITNQAKYNVTIDIVEENGQKLVKTEIINKIARINEAKDTYWFDMDSYMIVKHKSEDYSRIQVDYFENLQINIEIPDSVFDPEISSDLRIETIDGTCSNIGNVYQETKEPVPDLLITSYSYAPLNPIVGEKTDFSINVKNTGQVECPVTQTSIRVLNEDYFGNTVLSANTCWTNTSLTPTFCLQPDEEKTIHLNVTFISEGEHNIRIETKCVDNFLVGKTYEFDICKDNYFYDTLYSSESGSTTTVISSTTTTTEIPKEKYCEIDDDCTIQSTDNCCGREAVNKNYSNGTHQICLRICPDYTIKCENNICVLV